MREIFNLQTYSIPADGANLLISKTAGAASVALFASDGVFTVNTGTWTPGLYLWQYFDAQNNVLREEAVTVRQNLRGTLPADYNPLSPNRQALEAITAFLQGRATAQQRRVRVGDKEIEYSSFEELSKWKAYFEREVRKEEGKPAGLTFMKPTYRR